VQAALYSTDASSGRKADSEIDLAHSVVCPIQSRIVIRKRYPGAHIFRHLPQM
jgi:hypothetical protein